MSSNRASAALRASVVERAKGCCEYCLAQARFSPSPFSLEHVVPVSRRGSGEPENLALVCQGCNNHKYNHVQGVDPVSGDECGLYNPRTHIWTDNFRWTTDFTEIVGITASGRATVARLHLNRVENIELRRILGRQGLHPPVYPYACPN